jgi:glucan phosphoethanolaminetransferase (alkaline phosphatase superfamily)
MDFVINAVFSKYLIFFLIIVNLILVFFVTTKELKSSNKKLNSFLWIFFSIMVPLFVPLIYFSYDVIIRRREKNKIK